MIDKLLVQRKLDQMGKYLDDLRTVAQKPKTEFTGSPIHYEAERLIELIVGNALDINFHLIKVLDLPVPKQYKDSFITLGKANVLSPEFSQKIADSAGLRNLLVHQYDDVDIERLYDGLAAGIEDYEQYMKTLANYIAK
ncbi:DUF86 domain-containing protein [Candidatus Berkelbacteria bacterium]|nr:DUF86 domain-containing protein [Candidatus Berkelbacteria bacterium]